jgi:hypothetical protein
MTGDSARLYAETREIKMKIAAAVLALVISNLAFAHSGGTDSAGCHMNHKTGVYHCH